MPGKLFLLLMICRYIFNASWFCPEPYSPNQFASYLDISDQCKSLSTKPSISLGNWHRRKIVDAAFLQHAEENYLTRKSSISHVHQIRLSPSSDTAFNSWWSGYWAIVVPNLSEVQGKLVSRFRVLPNRPIRDELDRYMKRRRRSVSVDVEGYASEEEEEEVEEAEQGREREAEEEEDKKCDRVFCSALKSSSDEVVLLQDAVKERGTTRAVPTDVEQCRKTLKRYSDMSDKIHSLTDSINSANAELDPLCRQNPDFTAMFSQEKLNLQDEESNLSEFSCEERSLKTVIETLTAKQESAVFKITSSEKNADKTKQKMRGMKNTDGKVKKDEHICFQWQKEMRVK
ncbi:hypothetical protein NC653_030365 [Populus alba x Populus x berolinensis]|uniref:Uncharacterized protein n=2 Tax=Populus TaxID=3689 RepID=A0A4U5Q2H8_POPAL|nr:hypothetical protein NC653_030365 [Populus alba x Populus x berolinensis]TKS04284.1 hypothetical protein D5086_0000144850 [Populus alba]